MALDNDVPGPGAYPGLFERPYTPGGRMGPVPNLSRVPRVDGDDGVEPGPGWYSPRLPGTPGGKLVQGARDTIQLLGYPDEPGPGHYEAQRAMDYVEATDRTVTIPNSRPMTALERTILEGSRKPGPSDYDSRASMSYLEATDRTFTIPKTRPMTALERTILEGSRKPAPWDYSPQRIFHDPSASFGNLPPEGQFDANSFVHIAERHGRSTPAPGEYDLPGFGDESLGGQFQAGKRVDILTNLNGVPGPGTYNLPSTCLKECNMMPKFGSTLARKVWPNGMPGPGEYDVPDLDAGSRSIGRGTRPPLGSSSLRPPLNVPNDNPGPGTYEVGGFKTEFLGWGSMASTVSKFDPNFETTLKVAATEPGPSDYGNQNSTLSIGGGRFGRPYDPNRPWEDEDEMSYED